MPVILDATVSGKTSNSYVASTDEAVALLDASANRAAFVALVASDADEAARKLLRAARLIDMLVNATGEASVTTQAMQWPRYGCPHPSGWWWDGNIVPAQIRIAQTELAAWLASRPATEADPFGSDATQNIADVKAGPVSVTFREGSTLPGPDFVGRFIVPMLSAWGLALASSSVRLLR